MLRQVDATDATEREIRLKDRVQTLLAENTEAHDKISTLQAELRSKRSENDDLQGTMLDPRGHSHV